MDLHPSVSESKVIICLSEQKKMIFQSHFNNEILCVVCFGFVLIKSFCEKM